jgi:hypothetical protein
MIGLARRLFNTLTKKLRWALPDNLHHLYIGASGTGKTVGALVPSGRASLRDHNRGFHCIDPESELTAHFTEFCANPANGCADRVVHVLDASSRTETFGIPLIDVPSRDPQDCHNAAVRALAVFEQVVDFGASEYGPRLSKLMLLGMFGLALNGMPLVLLPEVYSTQRRFRALIGDAFPSGFMTEEWRGLDVLAEKNPRQFIEYRDSLISRMLPLFGSPALRRVFGQDPGRNLNIDHILANREVVLLPLGGLEPKDAVLIGTSYFSVLYAAALHRPIDNPAPADVMIDEASDYVTPDMLRAFERLRKRRVFMRVACQQLSQWVKPDDPKASALNSVLTNTRAKIVFGGLAPDDAELMAKLLFNGNINLDTVYKDGSVRPVAVGNDKVMLTSEAFARHHAEQRARAVSDSRMASRVRALADATSSAWASMATSGIGLNSTAMPDGGVITPPTVMSNGSNRNNSRGRSLSGARSRSQMFAEQDGNTHGETTIEGSGDGLSQARGSHETFVTRYAELATEAYSLEEKVHAVTGLIQNLPNRSCLVKIENNAPILTRTPDLSPAFRSAVFKAQALPLYRAKLLRTSRYMRPVEVVDAEIAQRLADVSDPEFVEPDFAAPEPVRNLRIVKGDN